MNSRIKLIKYALVFVFLFLGSFITCELHTLKTIENITSVPSIYFDKFDDNDEEIDRLLEIAKANNVVVYTVENDYSDYNCLRKKVYCLSEDQNKIINYFKIFNLRIRSVLYVNDIYIEFESIHNETRIGSDTHYYLLGNNSDINIIYEDLKKELSVSISGLNTDKGYFKNFVYIVLWFGIVGFVFILSNYDVNCNKKEMYIMILFGEKLIRIFIRHIIFELGFYLIVLIVIRNLINMISSWCLLLYINILTVGMFSAMPYLDLLKLDKSILINNIFSKRSLQYNYVFSFVTTALEIAVIVFTINTFGKYENYKCMKNFVEYFDEYSLCDFQYYKKDIIRDVYGTRKKDEILNELIYRKYDDIARPVILYNYTDNIIYSNMNAYDYLRKNMKELDEFNNDYDIVIFLPDCLDEDSRDEQINNALEVVRITEGSSFEFSFEVIKYHEKINLVTVRNINTLGFDFFKVTENPVVIYNSIVPHSLPECTLNETSRGGYMDDIMYRIDSELLGNIKIDFMLEDEICAVTNLKEHYTYFFKYIKRIMWSMYFIVGLIFLLEFSIYTAIVILNYRINKFELALKKVFGYSIAEKNMKTFIGSFISVILAIFLNMIVLKDSKVLIIGSINLFLVLFALIAQIKKNETTVVSIVIKRK